MKAETTIGGLSLNESMIEEAQNAHDDNKYQSTRKKDSTNKTMMWGNHPIQAHLSEDVPEGTNGRLVLLGFNDCSRSRSFVVDLWLGPVNERGEEMCVS